MTTMLAKLITHFFTAYLGQGTKRKPPYGARVP